MNLKEAMIKTIDDAKIYGRRTYLYLFQDGRYEITTVYIDKNWLFCAFPGGRKILSVRGKEYYDQQYQSMI